jgi:hypothetical protein
MRYLLVGEADAYQSSVRSGDYNETFGGVW